MHSYGGARYFVYGPPLFSCHRSRFFILSNCFDLSSDDQHILHHLFPQGKVFAIELSDFNSCSGCWGHVRLGWDSYWPCLLLSALSVVFRFSVFRFRWTASRSDTTYGIDVWKRVCGNVLHPVNYVHNKQHRYSTGEKEKTRLKL